MVKAIEFKKRFEAKDYYNVLEPITENCIIVCNNLNIMNRLADEIINTINSKAEYNDYWCDNEDVGKAKYELNFGLQKIIDINGQKITLALEPAIIYKAKQIEDIWFYDWFGRDVNNTYREYVYPMTIFKGSHDIWNEGLDRVYKMIVSGRYGAYDGKWTKLGEKERF